MSEALGSVPETLADLYVRGLRGQSDVYVIRSGPNETWGWGAGVSLFHVETPAGEPPDQDQVDKYLPLYAGMDPQIPHRLSSSELEARLAEYWTAVEETSRQ